MTLFHIGQFVTPKRSTKWEIVHGPSVVFVSPKYGDIYTVSGKHDGIGGMMCLFFEEMPSNNAYRADEFRPLDPAKLDIFRKLVMPIKGENVS